MNELAVDCRENRYKTCVVKYHFRWFKSGVAGGCLREGCVNYRKERDTFLGYCGYSIYTYYLVRDFSRLSQGEPIWCPFSKEEINYCLSEINRVLEKKKIKWKLKEKIICGIKTYILRVKIPNLYGRLQHLYILTRIRCIYEAPFCLYMMDALKLQKELKFQGGIEEAFIKVLNYAPSTNNNHFLGQWGATPFNTGRCVIPEKYIKFPGLSDIKFRFAQLQKSGFIHNLYGNEKVYAQKIITDKDELLDLDWWINGYTKYRKSYYHGVVNPEIPKYIRYSGYYKDFVKDQDYEKLKNWKRTIFDVDK